MRTSRSITNRRAHTLIELVAAMIASVFLLMGLGSIMFIARQVAYTPSDATRRSEAADIASQICDELRYATIVIQQTSHILEFVVNDRNADGTAEKIRYEWSGAAGAPLRKIVNGGTAVNVLAAVNDFTLALQQTPKTTAYATTNVSAEQLLLTTATPVSAAQLDINTLSFVAQVITPASFPSVPANATSWNLTKLEFYGRKSGPATDSLLVQIRPTGEPYDFPSSNVLGQAAIAESTLTSSAGWNIVTFASPIPDLAFSRNYAVVWCQTTGTGSAAQVTYNDSTPTGESESSDSGASWNYMSTRQAFVKIYGTYTTPGTTYNVTRYYVSSVRFTLQTGSQGNSRVDASAPMRNLPELLTTYWRTDFDRDPTTTNANGDSSADWALSGGGTFDTTKLTNGIWTATGAIESRPLADFTTTTTVEVRCRNTSVGGNGAVLRINADRQGGTYAPLLVYVQRQSDGTQTLTLCGKSNDATTKSLCSRNKLGSGLVRYRLTILPANNLVNLQINDEDQGTFTYPTYTPSTTTDRYATVYADTSSAEFDYVDVRVGTN